MWYEFIARMMSRAGGYLAAAGAAIGGAVLLIFGYRRRVDRAEQQGRTEGEAIERDRVRRETKQITENMEKRADEVKKDVASDTATDDDLRRRMRASATDSGHTD